MKRLTSVLLLFLSTVLALAQVATDKAAPRFTVSGKVTVSSSYCGGVEPPRDLAEKLSTPEPFAGMTLYVRKGAMNKASSPVIAEAVVAADGTYSFDLPAGTYCIIYSEQLKKTDSTAFASNNPSLYVSSNKCIQKWWKKGLRTVTVSDKNITGIDISFYKKCFLETFCPCVQYMGPMPP